MLINDDCDNTKLLKGCNLAPQRTASWSTHIIMVSPLKVLTSRQLHYTIWFQPARFCSDGNNRCVGHCSVCSANFLGSVSWAVISNEQFKILKRLHKVDLMPVWGSDHHCIRRGFNWLIGTHFSLWWAIIFAVVNQPGFAWPTSHRLFFAFLS